jgi:hypothetical protein
MAFKFLVASLAPSTVTVSPSSNQSVKKFSTVSATSQLTFLSKVRANFLTTASDSLSTSRVISVDHFISFIEATCTIASSKLFLKVLDVNSLPFTFKSFNSTTHANSSSSVTLTIIPSESMFLTGEKAYKDVSPAAADTLSSLVSSNDNVTS